MTRRSEVDGRPRFVVLRNGEWWESAHDLETALERASRFIGGEVYDRLVGTYLSPEDAER